MKYRRTKPNAEPWKRRRLQAVQPYHITEEPNHITETQRRFTVAGAINALDSLIAMAELFKTELQKAKNGGQP